jgi:hypothetical protein
MQQAGDLSRTPWNLLLHYFITVRPVFDDFNFSDVDLYIFGHHIV